MKHKLLVCGLIAAICGAPVHAQSNTSPQVQAAIIKANAASGNVGLLDWRTAYVGDDTAQAAFDTKYDIVLRPQHTSGAHETTSHIYLGLNAKGDLIGAITPFGPQSCADEVIGRPLALQGRFGTAREDIALGKLDRLQFGPRGGEKQTLCYFPFTLTAAQMEAKFAGLKPTDAMYFSIKVDDKVTHSIWTGPLFTSSMRGTAKTVQKLTVGQYTRLRDVLPMLAE